MCGICGILNSKKMVEEETLKRMASILSHRGPDDEGYYLKKNIGLGHRRLNIIDLETGHQPIHNEDSSIWIVFNGEIYNYKDLRKDLEERKHRFYTNTDTEVIIHLYEEKGADCVKDLRGMFAFAIWDANRKRLLLVRDRIGIKPLVYACNDNGLVFASELKTILKSNLVDCQLDYEALHRFLLFGYIPSPLTIFKEIRKLPPGYILIYQDGRIAIEKYWEIKIKEGLMSQEEYKEGIKSILRESVKMQLMSDVPLGAFLSGGMDSSSVVALMSEVADRPVKTFSIGFEEKSYSELRYAKIVADRFGCDHHEMVIRPDSVEIINKLINFIDEPFADISAIPTYLVSEFARREVTVALSGDGGDELFAGYDNYVANRIDGYYRMIPQTIRRGIANLVNLIPPTEKSKGLINKAKRFIEGSCLPEEGEHIRWMTFFTPEEIDQLYSKELREESAGYDFFQPYKRYLNQFKDFDPLTRELLCDLKVWMPDDILYKVDMMSMSCSLEARVPLLDHKLIEFAMSIPSNMKLKGFSTKYIFKEAMGHILPKEILNRREKMGFIIPIKNWLREDLREMMGDALSEVSIKREGFFNYPYIKTLIDEHLSGRKDHWHKLWALMVFMMWKKRWM